MSLLKLFLNRFVICIDDKPHHIASKFNYPKFEPTARFQYFYFKQLLE